MRAAGIRGAKRRGKPWRTTIGDPAAQKRPDLVKRDFTATAPDRLWVGDFTYLRTWEGTRLLRFIIDVYSRMIVGWQLASHMRTDLVLDALRMALATRQPGADFTLVAHTDHGSQYVSEDYTQQLDDARVLASVGSVGDAYDNALAESFVDSFKTELIKRPRLAQQHQARARDRRVGRVVQHPPAAQLDRQPAARRARSRLAPARLTLEHAVLARSAVHPERCRGVRPLRGRLRPTVVGNGTLTRRTTERPYKPGLRRTQGIPIRAKSTSALLRASQRPEPTPHARLARRPPERLRRAIWGRWTLEMRLPGAPGPA